MADAKISALSAIAAALGTIEIPVNDSGTTKKVTLDQIVTFLQTVGMPRVRKLGSDHTLASATATKMTDLDMTLEAGTYQFTYEIIGQSSSTSVGLAFGLNFTGTATVRAFRVDYPSTGTTANTGVADNVGAITGQLLESNPQTAFSTTAGNMGNTGVASANTNSLYTIHGTIVVTASGDLQLYHGSESATNTTVQAGTSLTVTRVA